MSLFWKQVLQSLVFGLVLPGILFSTVRKVPEAPVDPPTAQTQIWIPVIGEDGRLRAMELEDYVFRVVLGEMPAGFHMEALKAQAVAARTYTLWMVRTGDRHGGAVCTDFSCCQEYREPEAYLEAGGSGESVEKVLSAVEQTRGQVLYYGEELIMATYFACAGGRTEDAAVVWGMNYPYLQSVSSPETTGYDDDVVEVPVEDFWGALGCAPEDHLGSVIYTEGGGVASVSIGQQKYTGVELRSLFGLRSTVFQLDVTDDKVLFRTKGFGHRVGLSQYGSDALAQQGQRYDQILAHYYQGTTLGEVRND